MVAAVAGEVIIIGGMCAMGYDLLNGIMPTGFLVGLLPNYCMILFIAVAVFYCKKVEKWGLQKMGFCSGVFDYILGGVLAIVLLAVITCVCCACGVLTPDNKKKAKSALKVAGIIAGAILLIDVVSMIIYFILNGFPA